MTVVCVRDGVMATDSRATAEDGKAHRCEKLYRFGPLIVGVSGSHPGCMAFVRYFRARAEEQDDYDFEGASALVLCPKRGILIFDDCGEPDPVQEPFFAIGSGGQVALGAMHMGASAVQAVEAACRWNASCGLPIISMSMKRSRPGSPRK